MTTPLDEPVARKLLAAVAWRLRRDERFAFDQQRTAALAALLVAACRDAGVGLYDRDTRLVVADDPHPGPLPDQLRDGRWLDPDQQRTAVAEAWPERAHPVTLAPTGEYRVAADGRAARVVRADLSVSPHS